MRGRPDSLDDPWPDRGAPYRAAPYRAGPDTFPQGDSGTRPRGLLESPALARCSECQDGLRVGLVVGSEIGVSAIGEYDGKAAILFEIREPYLELECG